MWYEPASTLAPLADTYRVSNVDVHRAERVIHALVEDGVLDGARVRRPSIASAEELLAFHPASYLEETTGAARLARIFGVEEGALPVQEVLAASRWAVGATLGAARSVVAGGAPVAMHLGGGFHHAEPEQGSGFCVYNDVGVAIACLRREGFAEPIAVVDLDYHEGNGQLAAFANDPSVFIADIHGAAWSHVDAPCHVRILLREGTGDDDYLRAVDEKVLPALRSRRPALLFYIAGNDVLDGDRLGSFRLTPAGVLARDRRIVESAGELGAKLVITLGGGYSAGAWRSSAALVRWLLCGEVYVPPPGEGDLRERFTEIARTLDVGALRGGDAGFSLEMSDLGGEWGADATPKLLLDYYTPSGVEYALERYGFLDKIRSRGFSRLEVACDLEHKNRQLVRIFGEASRLPSNGPRARTPPPSRRPPAVRHLLLELALCRRRVVAPMALEPHDALELLGVEWLLLQDPTAAFSLERPPLPGQEHPGLGVAIETQEMLVQVCRRLDLEGLWHRPAHYHVARVGARYFRFLDPAAAGRFLALRRLLDSHDLAEATRWVEERRIVCESGRSIGWEPDDMVLPVSARLVEYFSGDAYRERVQAACDALLAEKPRLPVSMPHPER